MPFTAEDNLRLSIRTGLVKGLRRAPGLRRQLDDADRNIVADAIREHLALAGWRIEPGPGIRSQPASLGRLASRNGEMACKISK
jgi:hypothetical protein